MIKKVYPLLYKSLKDIIYFVIYMMKSGYHCNICGKDYKSYKTLWKHNKDFHGIKKDVLPTKNILSTGFLPPNNIHNVSNERPKKTLRNICNYCNLKYASYNGVLKHEKICKQKNNNIIEIPENNNTISQQIINILKEDNVNKNTINKINNLLSKLNITNNITNNEIITNNDIINNNGIINNNTINIIQLGNEELQNILTKKEILNVLNKNFGAILELIKVAHFNPKYPQLHSIILTDLNRNFVYVYDEEKKEYIIKNKDEAINSLIEYKICNIETLYALYKDKLNETTQKNIEIIIDHRYDNDETHKQNKEIRENINILMYNNRNTVKHLI